jgi:hypothetical protein
MSEEYLSRKKASMSEAMYKQEFEADFVIFTGAIYGGSVDSQILHNDEEIRKVIPEWPDIESWRQVLVGIDTGADHPFGAVKLISTEMGLVVVGEYLERDKTFIQHAAEIKRLAGSSTTKYAINKNERQPMMELAQHQIYCQPAENDQVSGIERVKSWLHTKQMWFVESRCPQTIKQLKAYRWAENTSPRTDEKRREKVFKLNDELCDGIRYSVMVWPVLPKGPPEIAIPVRDLSAMPDEMRASIQRMRKLDKDPSLPLTQDVTQDFWL